MSNLKTFRNLIFVVIAVLFTVVMFTACGDSKMKIAEPPTTPVQDCADVFSVAEVQMLIAVVEQFERTSGGQLRVLTVDTTDGIPIEEYSIRTATEWNIGGDTNGKGVLLTLAIRDHASRIEVGKSWEEPLTDARCGEVLRSIVPELRAEQYAEACAKAIRSLEQFFPENEGK